MNKFDGMFRQFSCFMILLVQVNAAILRHHTTQLKMDENDLYGLKTTVDDSGIRHSQFDQFQKNTRVDKNLAKERFTIRKTPGCALPRNTVHSKVKWNKFDLSWCLETPSQKLPICEQRETLELAFQIWSRSTVFRFAEVSCDEADIRFIFSLEYPSNEYHSDGQGGHQLYIDMAYTKKNGLKRVNVYFDEAENWRTENTHEASLLFAAAHGIGHSLGLGHSSDQRSIMIYLFYYPVSELSPTDKISLQQIYGKSALVAQKNPEATTITQIDDTTKTSLTHTIVPESTRDPLDGIFKPETELSEFYSIQTERTSLTALDFKNISEENFQRINPDPANSSAGKDDKNLDTIIRSSTIPQSTETLFPDNFIMEKKAKSKEDHIQAGNTSPFENVFTNKITTKIENVNQSFNRNIKMLSSKQTNKTVNAKDIESTENTLNQNLRSETETKSKSDENQTGSTSWSGTVYKNKYITHTIQPELNTVPTKQIDQSLSNFILDKNIPQNPLTKRLESEIQTKFRTDNIKTTSISLLENILKFKTRNNKTVKPTIRPGPRIITTGQTDQQINTVSVRDTNISKILSKTQLSTQTKTEPIQSLNTDSKELKNSSRLSNTLTTQLTTVTLFKSSILKNNGTFPEGAEYSPNLPKSVVTDLPRLEPSAFSQLHTNRPYSKTLQHSSTVSNKVAIQLPTRFSVINLHGPFSKQLRGSSKPPNIVGTQPLIVKPTKSDRVNIIRSVSRTLQDSPKPPNIVTATLPTHKLTKITLAQDNGPSRPSNTLAFHLSTTKPPSTVGRIQRSGSQPLGSAIPQTTGIILTSQLKPNQKMLALFSTTSRPQFSQVKLMLNSKNLALISSRDVGSTTAITPLSDKTKLLNLNINDTHNISATVIDHNDSSAYQYRCDSKIDNCEGFFCWFWEKVLEVCCRFYRWICSVFRNRLN